MAERLNVLVDGGKATPGPPLGPALGPLGVNIVEILKAINEK
ncbi:MAG: 50S ribosomal protein L11, partial [Methanobacteriota archaeon]